MTKILISNFPKDAVSVNAQSIEDEKKLVRFHVGYDPKEKFDEIQTSALSSFFSSLIVHDEIFITLSDFYLLLNALGPTDAINLLDRKIVKILNTTEDYALWEGDLGTGVISLGGIKLQEDRMIRFERFINKSQHIKASEKPILVQYTANAKIDVSEEVYKLRHSEIEKDLAKGIFSGLGVTTASVDNVQGSDAFKLLRIAGITEQLLLQNHLGLDSIAQDGFVKQYFEFKFGALTPLSEKDTLSPFANVAKLKGLPDLYSLYKHGTIKMDNILACRETFSGGLFRRWYSSTDYDEQSVIRALLNKNVKESTLIKFVRLIYPNVLGLVGPIAGLAASAVDSYIVSKLIEGWRPSLFLDDVFKRKIDQYIAANEASEKRKEIVKRFGKVDRNAPCPCQSGKKFKSCHGK